MKGFVQNIESVAVKNEEFRRVLYTAKNCQLVVMALKSKEEIGAEVHKLDQFFRVEEGTGEAVLDGVRTAISAGFAVARPGRDESQHHQHRQCSAEALYALCAAESSGWRRPSYPRRRGGG
jgi:mannose-6-phosphate isomerase-like protein (cupin superfamily)